MCLLLKIFMCAPVTIHEHLTGKEISRSSRGEGLCPNRSFISLALGWVPPDPDFGSIGALHASPSHANLSPDEHSLCLDWRSFSLSSGLPNNFYWTLLAVHHLL